MCTSDGDCAVAPCLPPVDRIEIPTSTDCAPGGLCDSLGKLSTQCAPLGRSVTGGAQVVLTTGTGSFSTDTSGSVLVGWTEGPLPPFPVSYSDPVGPNGARINTGTVFAAYECWMGRANGGGTGGVALDDVELVSLPILN